MNNIPDGFILDNSVLWDVRKDFVIAKGFEFQPADLTTSDREPWMQQVQKIRGMMGSLDRDERLQISLHTGSYFDPPLSRYESTPCSGIVKEIRTEISERFRKRVSEETLIQSNVRIYLCKHLKLQRRTAFDQVFKVAQHGFEQRASHFEGEIRAMGGSFKEMDDQAHYLDILQHWSPGQFRKQLKEPAAVDFKESIETLCNVSSLAPQVNHDLFIDGYYVGLWIFRHMPGKTHPRTMESFFNLNIPGLFVTLNLLPLSVSEQLKHEDARAEILAKNKVSPSSSAGLEGHFDKGRSLVKNEILPFKAQVIVKVYAKSQEDLDDKMEAVRGALDHTGARGYRPALPSSAIAYFNCTTPGFGPWTGYKDHWHKIFDENLAHLWPVGATPEAELQNADWITCGNQNNLIGGRLFVGAQPADMLCLGTKGAGKSSTMQSIVLQSAHQFNFMVIVDEGRSWIRTAQLLDPTSHPIIVRVNGDKTFNLFDTKKLSLSPQHRRNAVSLAQMLVGLSADEDKQADRAAILSEAINSVYNRAYLFWKNENPALHYRACVLAASALKSKEDFVDAVQALQGRELDATEEEATSLEKDPEKSHYVRDAAFSMWEPEMFPTLLDLWDELNSKKDNPIYESLANRLKVWRRDGDYGKIVDGISNIDLGTRFITKDSPLKVVHFELEKVNKSEEKLKDILSFLIVNEVRSLIQSMPRAVKKAMIIEELTSFLRVPNASEIIVDYSERMRKYNCWLLFICQQYSSLLKADPQVAEAVIGNVQTMILLLNLNGKDLESLDTHIHLPGPIISALGSFPLPELMRGRPDAYAGFVYVQRSSARPTFTIGRNVISDRLEKIVSSSPDTFEEKAA